MIRTVLSFAAALGLLACGCGEPVEPPQDAAGHHGYWRVSAAVSGWR